MSQYSQSTLCTVHVWLKAGIHYKLFAQIFAPIYSLEQLFLVAESQSQSADLSWQIP